jgi:hypothetical protein
VAPCASLEQVREILAHEEVERLAAEIDWTRARQTPSPPQSWFDDKDDNPFEPDKVPAS